MPHNKENSVGTPFGGIHVPMLHILKVQMKNIYFKDSKCSL